MSRKKLIIDKNICKNIKELRKITGLNGTNFANNIGITQGYLSDIENCKQAPSKTLLLAISFIYNTSIEWLKTGRGEMFLKAGNGDPKISEKVAIYNKVGERMDDDSEIDLLLSMTKEVLKSKTDYAASLTANIYSFFRSIKLEKRISKVEIELSAIKEKINKCPSGSGESVLRKKI